MEMDSQEKNAVFGPCSLSHVLSQAQGGLILPKLPLSNSDYHEKGGRWHQKYQLNSIKDVEKSQCAKL